MEDDERFVEEWKEERKRGKFKYIITHAIRQIIIVILFGVVISFLAVSFVSMYTGTKALDILNIYVLKKTLINFSSVFIAYIFSSYLEWNSNEKRYNKLLNNK